MKKFILVLAFAMLLCLFSCGDADIVIHTSLSTPPAQPAATVPRGEEDGVSVVINKSSMVFHFPDCAYAVIMSPKNRMEITVDAIDDLLTSGYTPCGGCAADYKNQNSEESTE